MSQLTEVDVAKAVKLRQQYIQQNIDSLSMKGLRKLLAEDLGVSAENLKRHKIYIEKLVDRAIGSSIDAVTNETNAVSGKKLGKKSSTQNVKSSTDSRPKRQQAPPAAVGPKEYSKAVNCLKAICKQAGIIVPPNIYSKNKSSSELEAAFQSLLEKRGLGKHSSASEISAVAKQLQKEKDLEGIDRTNILQEGRRRRAAVNYSEVLKPQYTDSSESSSGQDEEVSDNDESSASDVESDSVSNEENRPVENGMKSKQQRSGKKQSRKLEKDSRDDSTASSGASAGALGDGEAPLNEEETVPKSSGKSFGSSGKAKRKVGTPAKDNLPNSKRKTVDWSDDE